MIPSHLYTSIVMAPMKFQMEGWYGWVQSGGWDPGWSGLSGARDPPAVADSSTNSPAGDNGGEGGLVGSSHLWGH